MSRFTRCYGAIQSLGGRQNLGYSHSNLWRFAEETAAETFATGSLGRGVAHALHPAYGINLPRVGAEAAGLGLAGYGIYEASR